MKRVWVITLLLPLAIMTLQAGAVTPQEISSEIKHVTLYSDRGMIMSEAITDLPAGESVLVIRGLSPYIDQRTIEVTGQGNFMIMNVTHANNYLAATEQSTEEKRLRSRIAELEMMVEDEQTAIAVLKEREAFLTANRVIGGTQGMTTEQLRSMLEFYTRSIEEIRTTILTKNRVVKKYQEEIEELRRQLGTITGRGREPTGEITISVNASRAGRAEFSVNYMVTGAGWYPSYDIRVSEVGKPLELVYKANVSQRTGNDWKGVSLTLTNASPTQPGVLPVLRPWFLGFHEPVILRELAGKASGIDARRSVAADRELSPMIMEAEEAMPKAETPGTTMRQSGSIVLFEVSVPSDIPSDNSIRTIETGRRNAEATYIYQAIPKLNQSSFLTARIEKWGELNIIGGEANIYLDNTFAGKTSLSPEQIGDTMTLSLGIDKGVTIKRERIAESTLQRLFGSNRIDTRSFRMTVRNNKQEAVTIRITDQIPISTSNEITIESIELSGGSLNKESGMVLWELNLEPQQTRELVLTYSVRYPASKQVLIDR